MAFEIRELMIVAMPEARAEMSPSQFEDVYLSGNALDVIMGAACCLQPSIILVCTTCTGCTACTRCSSCSSCSSCTRCTRVSNLTGHVESTDKIQLGMLRSELRAAIALREEACVLNYQNN